MNAVIWMGPRRQRAEAAEGEVGLEPGPCTVASETVAPTSARHRSSEQDNFVGIRYSPAGVSVVGAASVMLCMVFAASQGAFAIEPGQWLSLLGLSSTELSDTVYQVFVNIRLPRLLLAIATGVGLGIAGALMQGIFRNPLADPGLIGVSSGAALAAGLTIVVGAVWFPELPRKLGSWTLVLTAFAGGLTVTALIYGLAQRSGLTSVAMMLIAGIAVNAFAGAGLGFLVFLATDEQLRSLQFWLLGSLGGARWSSVIIVGLAVAAATAFALALARPLNAIALGEAQAALMGIAVEPVKRTAVVITALAVGCVTATTGIVGFVGLIAPHVMRMLVGPDHRLVLPGSAFLGACLVLLADCAARTLAKPAELPLGVLTAALGVPVFLVLLRSQRTKIYL
jgi:iron complex transport system permease protein